METIVATAMAKEKERRYASAAVLATDIRHFLGDQPIAARPTTALYHLRKFARRSKPLVAGIAIALLAMTRGHDGLASPGGRRSPEGPGCPASGLSRQPVRGRRWPSARAILVSVSGDGTLRIWDTAPEWTRWRARHRLLDQGAARK